MKGNLDSHKVPPEKIMWSPIFVCMYVLCMFFVLLTLILASQEQTGNKSNTRTAKNAKNNCSCYAYGQ